MTSMQLAPPASKSNLHNTTILLIASYALNEVSDTLACDFAAGK